MNEPKTEQEQNAKPKKTALNKPPQKRHQKKTPKRKKGTPFPLWWH
jgi:hypothetical protein